MWAHAYVLGRSLVVPSTSLARAPEFRGRRARSATTGGKGKGESLQQASGSRGCGRALGARGQRG